MAGILNITTAFSLGAMHALEPGHGKSFIASYMLGNKTNKWHIITLGASLALSHTIVLLVVGLLLNYLLPQIENEKIEHYIEIIAPLIMIGVGIYLLYKIKHHIQSCSCAHHKNEKQHNKLAAPKKINLSNLKLVTPQGQVEVQVHTHKTTALIGIVAGLLPCPSALAAFVTAGSSGSVNQSFWYILIYVVGFVVVMMAIALLMFVIGNKASGLFNHRMIKHIEYISAFLIIGVGTVYLFNNLFFHHH
ncbi:MAG: sulfite exporter TauE/SafE family protein [Bacteroidetes bacterium]|nr:sulfite exporter TauE/SafE family protein [Bacteroidota bacterium]